MRLVSLNVALFEQNNRKLKAFFTEQNADILCLQEVTRKIDKIVKPRFVSKNAIDRASSNLHHSFFGPMTIFHEFSQKNFHGQDHFYMHFGGPLEFGNYVRSKYPIFKAQNIFVQNHFSYNVDLSKWPDEDYRAVQVVDLNIGTSQKLRLLNYHGIWTKDKLGNEKAFSACKQILALAQEVDYPAIITGDFNLYPDTPSIKIFNKDFRSLVDEYHISTTRPKTNELSHLKRNVVDYIFVSKGIKVKSFEVIDTDVSDHLPLVLDFNL